MDYGTSGRLWDALILSPMYEDTLNTRLSLPYYKYIILNQGLSSRGFRQIAFNINY